MHPTACPVCSFRLLFHHYFSPRHFCTLPPPCFPPCRLCHFKICTAVTFTVQPPCPLSRVVLTTFTSSFTPLGTPSAGVASSRFHDADTLAFAGYCCSSVSSECHRRRARSRGKHTRGEALQLSEKFEYKFTEGLAHDFEHLQTPLRGLSTGAISAGKLLSGHCDEHANRKGEGENHHHRPSLVHDRTVVDYHHIQHHNGGLFIRSRDVSYP